MPTMCVFEVFKRVTQLKSESAAMEAVGLMLQGHVVDLNSGIALEAARISLERASPWRIRSSSRPPVLKARVLWTQDAHFGGLEGVEFRAKPTQALWMPWPFWACVMRRFPDLGVALLRAQSGVCYLVRRPSRRIEHCGVEQSGSSSGS